ncbi:MAG: hypothetical protein HGA98_05130 [Deltaproteobacteria bacterium]|nr:hypothetical protein [Deltaproteobacteria bacterium]
MKIHIRSGKLTLHRYDDFWGQALPKLRERIKIKMREQDIDFFEYGEEFPDQYLYLDSHEFSGGQAANLTESACV